MVFDVTYGAFELLHRDLDHQLDKNGVNKGGDVVEPREGNSDGQNLIQNCSRVEFVNTRYESLP